MIATFILYTVTAISCFGGHISPDITPIGSVLTIGMPYFVTITAVVMVVWFCFGHWIVGGLGVVMFMVCVAPIRSWFPMHTAPKANPDTPTFTVLTWNTYHMSDLEKPEYDGCRTLEEILRIDADIVCLQEIFGYKEGKLNSPKAKPLIDSLKRKYPYELGDGTYDQRTYSKYPLRHIYFGHFARYNLAEYFTVKIHGREIGMANIHLPSFCLDESEKGIFSTNDTVGGLKARENLGKRIYQKLKHAIPIRTNAARRIIDGFESLAMPVIVIGDFNDVPASYVYRMFEQAGFKDAYVETNFFPTFTYYPHGFYFHLDQIFYRGGITPLSVKKLNIRTSDHLPLLATFEIDADPYPIEK